MFKENLKQMTMIAKVLQETRNKFVTFNFLSLSADALICWKFVHPKVEEFREHSVGEDFGPVVWFYS